MVGLEHADDAGVYRISPDLAMIQTVDFFTPIVDDPYAFGQIAAANALSDIYAMGGIPKTALNLVAFPVSTLDISILREIIQGGMDKLREAGAVLLGGHSIEDKELKYGMSVTGFIHPDRILTKRNIRPGDHLVLTKPLGTGIINTAIKGGLASEATIQYATGLMAGLNKYASQIMLKYPVHACTDITGFGLAGHLAEMVVHSGCGVSVFAEAIPIMPGVAELANMGLIPAGTYRNREFRQTMVEESPSLDPVIRDILFDPQTSGGLLISVDSGASNDLVLELRENGSPLAAVIGNVVEEPSGKIVVQ
jgi:selenide,water dikinase